MTDTSLIAFKAISNFTTELSSIFGDKFKPLKLYCHLVKKTNIMHEKAIARHIDAFKTFCLEDREAIISRNVRKLSTEKISYSKPVYIPIKDVFEDADPDIRDDIWKHILTISAILDPAGNAKNILKGKGGNEADFLSDIISSVEKNVDPNCKDPMVGLASVMKDGTFTNMVTKMGQGLQDGSLDIGKLMGSVTGMIGELSGKAGDVEGGQEAMSMVSNMMSGITGATNGDQPNLAGMMSGMMGNMLAGQGGIPDLTQMMGGGQSIGEQIDAQVQSAKANGELSKVGELD